MNNPKISVLIPAYNHGKYMNDTIESVLNQTFPDFELLISDDCSTDDTTRIIKSYSDKRITGIFFNENQGTVRSLNHLLSIAKGEYIAVLGSDDVWEPDKLKKQLEVLEGDSTLAACFSWATIINQNSDIIDDELAFPIHIFNIENSDRIHLLREFFVSGNHFCHSSVLIRKCVHDKIGEYNIAYRQLHDFDLWVRLLLQYNVSVVKEPLVKYRFIQNSGSLSEASTENNFRLYNEAESIISFLFENISREDFLAGFSKDFVGTNISTDAQIACEKFLILKKRKLWIANNTSLALEFLFRHMNAAMLLCFETDYGISLKQLYDYTSIFKSTYYAELYSQVTELRSEINRLTSENDRLTSENDRLASENDRQRTENEYLKFVKNEIYNSTSWKITKPIRYIMSKLRRMRGN